MTGSPRRASDILGITDSNLRSMSDAISGGSSPAASDLLLLLQAVEEFVPAEMSPIPRLDRFTLGAAADMFRFALGPRFPASESNQTSEIEAARRFLLHLQPNPMTIHIREDAGGGPLGRQVRLEDPTGTYPTVFGEATTTPRAMVVATTQLLAAVCRKRMEEALVLEAAPAETLEGPAP